MNARKLEKRILCLAVFLVLPLLAACDSSGTVRGTLQFYQNQGNFCPVGRDCTGAKYTQAQFATSQPIRNVKVYIRRQSNNQVIGQGTTNGSGQFNIAWNVPGPNNKDIPAQLIIRYEHQDNRFTVNTEAGGMWVAWSNFVAEDHNASQNLGNLTWGSAAAPHALSNVYDGAQKMWNNALGQSNRMLAYFNSVSVRAFDVAGLCPTSCASGPNNRIRMDPNSAYSPQARIMHEMGHIASYVASRDQSYTFGGNYCFPGNGTGCGWNMNSAEHGAAQFEEGVATHLADVSLYFPNAPQPHTCISAGSCPNNSFDLETSLGNACTNNQTRRPIQSDRYHWDNYDSLNDYTAPAVDALSMGMWHVVDTIHALDNGTGDDDKDEPWNAAYTGLDDLDGRSNLDFQQAWNTWGTNSATQLAQNCGGVGD